MRTLPAPAVDPDAPVTWAVETTMYRALAVLRVVVLVNMVGVNIYRRDSFSHPFGVVAVVAALVAWTAFVIWAYDAPQRRRTPVYVVDLVVSTGAILLSPYLIGSGMVATLPGFWVMGVVLAWGIHWHWVGGAIASVTVSLADIATRADLNETNYGNIFLLMIGGPVVGYLTGLLKEMASARDRAERAAATAAERARLARVVHDGVLQVLALVQRRGLDAGADAHAAELGRLAAEQEEALRALVQEDATAGRAPGAAAVAAATARVDLMAALRPLQSRLVSVAGPGGAVELPGDCVEELVRVVGACLDNVRRHVGADAPAWVLVEDLGSTVSLTVRDEGPGITSGRLDEAAREGRLGVRQSICGRMSDLGGTATLTTAPGRGTEWELTVPRR